jgi:hypothetical protein
MGVRGAGVPTLTPLAGGRRKDQWAIAWPALANRDRRNVANHPHPVSAMAISSDASMAVGFFVSAASVAWSAAFAWSRWLQRPRDDHAPQPLPHQLDDRLAGIERAIDAMSVELERLGEGQRFTTRLLAERAAKDASPLLLGEHRRVDTPH